MSARNWRQYNRSLIQRGSLTFFCHPTVARELRKAQRPRGSMRGRPAYPNQLILVLILLKISYGLTYRSCTGMALSLFAESGVQIPCYSTLCRSMRRLTNCLPKLSKRRPKRFLIDSSGFKITGEGEWKVKVHGSSKRRSWVKVHLLVDSKSNEIVDLVVTPSEEADITVAKVLLRELSGPNKELLADGAYDGGPLRKLGYKQGVDIVAPPPKNAKKRKGAHLALRNEAIDLIALLGGDRVARSIWGKMTGYNHRVKAESAFSRLKRLFGASAFSQDPNAQLVELWLKAWLSNFWLNSNYA